MMPRQTRADARRTVHTIVAGVVVFCLQFAHGPATAFLYDAVQYWYGPLALLRGENVSDVGVLTIRGVLTPLVYLPPAIGTSILGDWSAVWTVLCWNALLSAVICVVLLPRIAERVAPGGGPLRIWVAAVLGGVLLSGFSAYPLLDVWSLAFVLTGLLSLLTAQRWWSLSLGGLSLAVAVSLRPSYLIPVMIAGVIVLLARPRQVAWSAVGAVSGIAPQVLFNALHMGQISASPVGTAYLLQVQAAQASYAIRYDTVAFFDRHPQQWYCAPEYAALLVKDPEPTGPAEVLMSAVRHLPESLWFWTEKAAANLHWSFSTPYENPPVDGTSLMTLIVVGVSGIGLVALIWQLWTPSVAGPRRTSTVALLGLWAGALGTLLLSTPETRFALPLVVIGLVGVIAVVPGRPALPSGRPRTLAAFSLVAVALVLLLFFGGKAGLAHPLPPGPMPDIASCIAAGVGERG